MNGGPLSALAPFGGHRFSTIHNVVVLPTCPSTNGFARQLVEKMIAEDSEMPVTAVITMRQSGGRGRNGRAWVSPGDGSLALSLVLPWPEGPERVRVPIETGVRIARAVAGRFGVLVRVKWPNDLLVGRRKLGGILVEARAAEDGIGYAIAGVGLNLRSTRAELDGAGLSEATSLALEGVPAEALEGSEGPMSLLDALDHELGEEIPDLAAAFLEVSAHSPGDRLTVRSGDRAVEGTFEGLTPDGLLRLRTASGEETLVSGEITSF